MALPELLEALRQDAARRRAEIESASREAEARLRTESDARLRHRRADFLARAEGEATEAARRILARARVEAMREVLAARSRLLSRVRAETEARVSGADRAGDFIDSAVEDACAALDRVPRAQVVVRASPALLEPLSAALAGREQVTVVGSEDGSPGFVVESSAGSEVDGTLLSRLEQSWPRLAIGVLKEVDG